MTRFDDEAFDFDLLLAGRIKIGHLLHRYGPAANLISEDFIRAWVLHNIEESGETEKFVPKQFEQARQG